MLGGRRQCACLTSDTTEYQIKMYSLGMDGDLQKRPKRHTDIYYHHGVCFQTPLRMQFKLLCPLCCDTIWFGQTKVFDQKVTTHERIIKVNNTKMILYSQINLYNYVI